LPLKDGTKEEGFGRKVISILTGNTAPRRFSGTGNTHTTNNREAAALANRAAPLFKTGQPGGDSAVSDI
jgi:hypothetical protein